MASRNLPQYGYWITASDGDCFGEPIRHLTLTLKGGHWEDQSKRAAAEAKHGQTTMATHHNAKAIAAGQLSGSTETFDTKFRDEPEFTIRWQSTPKLSGWYGGHLETDRLSLNINTLSAMSSAMSRVRKALQDTDSFDPITLIPVILAALKAQPIRYSGWDDTADHNLNEYIHADEPDLSELCASAFQPEPELETGGVA